MTNPTRVCPECDELGKISEIGKKDYCKEDNKVLNLNMSHELYFV